MTSIMPLTLWSNLEGVLSRTQRRNLAEPNWTKNGMNNRKVLNLNAEGLKMNYEFNMSLD